MFKVRFSHSVALPISLTFGALLAGCGGGQDPILGANVVSAVLVAPAGALVPPVVSAVPPPVGTPPVAPAPGTCQMTVLVTDPTNGAQSAATSTTGVAGNGKRITATLNGTVDSATVNSNTFQLAQTGQPPLTPALVAYDVNTKVASLTTSAALLPATNYTVVFTPNAPTPACAFTWTFKTAAAPLVAPSPVSFGAAGSFAIAATAGVANTAATLINGDVVLNPTDTCNAVPVGGSGTFGLCGGVPPSVNGTVITPTYPNTTLAKSVTDALRATYLTITPPAGPPAAGSLGGGTTLATTSIGAPTGSPAVTGLNYFVPGVYTSGSTIVIAGDVTLDGKGDPNAVFVFQAGSAITATPGAPTPAAHSRIVLTNGAKASNVFWQAGSSATIGNYAEWYGNVLAGADITMQTLANSCGRMFAGAFTSGALVFDHNVVSIPGHVNAPAGCQ
ncbi:MAG: ice-binding family protein [Burkholderiaceae bacterium]